jgi:hypothetical protein
VIALFAVNILISFELFYPVFRFFDDTLVAKIIHLTVHRLLGILDNYSLTVIFSGVEPGVLQLEMFFHVVRLNYRLTDFAKEPIPQDPTHLLVCAVVSIFVLAIIRGNSFSLTVKDACLYIDVLD